MFLLNKNFIIFFINYNQRLCHFCILGCLAHMLKEKTNKMKLCSEACLFIGYPKGMRDGFFYYAKDNKVLVSTNAILLEQYYIKNDKLKDKVIIEEITREASILSIQMLKHQWLMKFYLIGKK